MSGGYTPNSNFGDDIGIFEYIREECFGGSDAFVYQIFNPNNADDEFGGWSSPGTMEFCVHGTNDQPVLVLPYSDGNVDNITTHSFNEDEDLTIDIEFRPEEDADAGGYSFEANKITIIDPDYLQNDIDLNINPSDNSIATSCTYDGEGNFNRLIIDPGADINGNYQITVYAEENYENCQIELSDGTYQD